MSALAHLHTVPMSAAPLQPPAAAASATAADTHPQCIFCTLQQSAAERTLYADELVYVVRDIRPAARLHLLVITRAHVRDCNTVDDDQLVAHMQRVGERMLLEHGRPGEQQRMGFHVPPCISVPHLHMHVLSGPFGGPCQRHCCGPCCAPLGCLRAKYTDWCCWYRDVGRTRRKLERDAVQTGQTHGYGAAATSSPSPMQQHMN